MWAYVRCFHDSLKTVEGIEIDFSIDLERPMSNELHQPQQIKLQFIIIILTRFS